MTIGTPARSQLESQPSGPWETMDGLRYLHAGYAAGAVARLPGCFGANLIRRVGLDADPRSPDRAAAWLGYRCSTRYGGARTKGTGNTYVEVWSGRGGRKNYRGSANAECTYCPQSCIRDETLGTGSNSGCLSCHGKRLRVATVGVRMALLYPAGM